MRLTLALLLSLSVCSSDATESIHNEKNDYYVLLSNLLGINETRYSYTDDMGNTHSDQLKLFKELEEIYIRYIVPDNEDGTYSIERVKVIMFLAFYAEQRNSAAFNEYLASDLKPIYSKNRQSFLRVMSELPFLIPSTCNRLNAYFGFEGKNMSGKNEFIENNEVVFEKYFNKDQKAACMSQFGK